MASVQAYEWTDMVSLFVLEDESGTGGLQEFLGRMLLRSAEWFRASGVSIFLFDEVSGGYLLAGQVGPNSHIPEGTVLRSGEGFAGQAIASGQPIILQGDTTGKSISSSMVIPLVGRRGPTNAQGCIGVLNLSRSAAEDGFREADLALAHTLGQHISLAVANAATMSQTRYMSEMLRVLLANVGFAVLSFDADRIITHFNPEAVLLLGAMITPNGCFDHLLEDIAPDVATLLIEASEQCESEGRARRRHAIRNRIWNVTASRLPSGGTTIALQDVTELESAQREYERLKRLAEVGQMTATIAHEIRNPLTGVQSAAKLIQESPELSDEFAQIIETEAKKLSQLCDEFLEFARPLKLEKEPTDIGEMLTHVVKTLEAQFAEADVILACKVPETAAIHALDRRRFEQVLRNLLLNALQATKPGGRVDVGAQTGHLWVQDTGCGMDEDTVARLFSPFFTTKAKGTGLGLSMVRKVLDAHEAHIEVYSKPGQGTRFEIRINEEIAR